MPVMKSVPVKRLAGILEYFYTRTAVVGYFWKSGSVSGGWVRWDKYFSAIADWVILKISPEMEMRLSLTHF